MSTSPSRAPAPVPLSRAGLFDAQPFPYDAVSVGASRSPSQSENEDTLAVVSREAQARGRQEGLAEGRGHFEEKLEQERSAVAAALAQFTRDRAAYFQKIEAEVVQLALAIARKILHREAQLDPLLLAGIVRVALEQIDGATGVKLRVHPQSAAEWRAYLATHLEPTDLPEFVEDPTQPADRCTLETSMGTAILGVEVQLKEIEQGLMDLLAARPGAAL